MKTLGATLGAFLALRVASHHHASAAGSTTKYSLFNDFWRLRIGNTSMHVSTFSKSDQSNDRSKSVWHFRLEHNHLEKLDFVHLPEVIYLKIRMID
jgi:hypothetical protein